METLPRNVYIWLVLLKARVGGYTPGFPLQNPANTAGTGCE
jgi:hypothetical protein